MDKQRIAQAIIDLAAEMGRTHPKTGWDDVNTRTGFQTTIMAMTGNVGGNLVECLASVGLVRAEVVDAFVLAKPRLSDKRKGAATVKSASVTPVAPVPVVAEVPSVVVPPAPPSPSPSPKHAPNLAVSSKKPKQIPPPARVAANTQASLF